MTLSSLYSPRRGLLRHRHDLLKPRAESRHGCGHVGQVLVTRTMTGDPARESGRLLWPAVARSDHASCLASDGVRTFPRRE